MIPNSEHLPRERVSGATCGEVKSNKQTTIDMIYNIKNRIWNLVKLSVFTFPFSVFVASCSNDDIVPDTPKDTYQQLTFSSADEPSTRAAWADPNGSGSLIYSREEDNAG